MAFDQYSSLLDGFKFSNSFRLYIVAIIAIVIILISGIGMAIGYSFVDSVQTSLESKDCVINGGDSGIDTCQDLFGFALYKVLALRSILIYITYLEIFAIVAGFFYLGFKSRNHPALFFVHVLCSLGVTYLSIIVSNIYRRLIDNELFYNMVVNFPVYNKVMLYFPQFIMICVFTSGLIGFMGIFKGSNIYNEGVDDFV